ncbi:MAG: putative HD phosphohydrolase [Candidatus Azotimanducaceae bacterium]
MKVQPVKVKTVKTKTVKAMLVNADQQLLSLLAAQKNVGYIGEPVSQLAHVLQCAHFARLQGASEVQQLAALCHDIGHVCDPHAPRLLDKGVDLGAAQHEHLGAAYLIACGVDEQVATLVQNHVNAKRYLVATRQTYASKLSKASVSTLALQGGPMTAGEALRFEAHPQFSQILQLRAWDEAAKQADLVVPPLSSFEAMLRRNTHSRLSRAQLAAFAENGFVLIKDWFNDAEVMSIVSDVDGMQDWPETVGKWMRYYERTNNGRQLCRIENFLPYHPALSQIARGTSTLALMSELMQEPAVLFKEKLNVKLAGGNGFAAHQDAPAFTSFDQQYHITMMLSIDATTKANGCLEVAAGQHQRGLLPMQGNLTLSDQLNDELDWQAVETQAGDLLLFDSFLPHRSAGNMTDASRRALYITYNRAREGGDVRDAYFMAKRAAFPPDIEREPDKSYDPGVFNVGNPVD